MQNTNFSFINLGCSKNLVDTQYLLGKILTENPGRNYYSDPFDPAVKLVYVNTCGFISSGREEAEHTIKKLLSKNKEVIGLGCAVEYFKKLKKEDSIFDTIKCLSRKDILSPVRLYTNAEQKFEYLKIAEGCNNKCSFCIIPKIRGIQKSLPIENIIQEIHNMIAAGIEEIILIAQDTTRYGTDIYGKPALFDLLQEIEKIKGKFTYRLLYLYPDILSLEHLKKLTTFKKFIPYFDIPLQHISCPILKLMGRFYDENMIYKFLDFIKDNFPKRFIRTNIIIGFPGETEADHKKLLDFLNKDYFNNIALFEYHDEPLAASSKLPNKIDYKLIKERFLDADEIVDKLLTKKEKSRKGKQETGYITEIRQCKDVSMKRLKDMIVIRPLLHCPEIDGTDKTKLDQITKIYNNKRTLDIGDKVDYIV